VAFSLVHFFAVEDYGSVDFSGCNSTMVSFALSNVAITAFGFLN